MPLPALKSLLAAAYIAFGVGVQAQSSTVPASCSSPSAIVPLHGQPSVAPGWNVRVVIGGMRKPRGIVFDTEGHLLVVEQGHGIARVTLKEDSDGACLTADGEVQIIADEALNHGIEFSADGKTLYASTPQVVYAWDYDASQGRNTSGPREIIGGMGKEDGHVTRTLLMSRKVDGLLLVSRGSMSNLDPAALDVSTGVSTIKAFAVSNVTDSPYNYAQDGLLLGWGLRNSVGVAEDPATGAIYSVENSVDNFVREGQNIHENNPGEEMNFHGYLNGTYSEQQGHNYGYPSCYAAWDADAIPNNNGIKVGTQFAIGDQNATLNDTFCRDDRVAPMITFAAHMAPLDIKFNNNGTAAWVSFHGSWNRDQPQGYKLSVIEFENGQPTEPADSKQAVIDIVSNPDVSRCPDECFRPVGLAWDRKGRLFMSSDDTGEIYVVARADGGSANDASRPSSGSASPTGTGAAPSPTKSAGRAMQACGRFQYVAAVLVGFMALQLPFM